MLEAKPAATPMETNYLSNMDEASPKLPNNTKYHQVLGSLLYITTTTRLDIAAAVGILCRQVESPTEHDWKSVKQVLRYLVDTIDAKLHLSANSKTDLKVYMDADWEGDHTDRK